MAEGGSGQNEEEFIPNDDIHNLTASIDDPLISSIDTYDTADITTSQDTDSNEGFFFFF